MEKVHCYGRKDTHAARTACAQARKKETAQVGKLKVILLFKISKHASSDVKKKTHTTGVPVFSSEAFILAWF